MPTERLQAGVSLSGQKRELSSIKEHLISQYEERIIDRELARLRKLSKDTDLIIEQMRNEMALLTEVYNGDWHVGHPAPDSS